MFNIVGLLLTCGIEVRDAGDLLLLLDYYWKLEGRQLPFDSRGGGLLHNHNYLGNIISTITRVYRGNYKIIIVWQGKVGKKNKVWVKEQEIPLVNQYNPGG